MPLLRLLNLSLVIVFVLAPNVLADWTQFQGNAKHTGFADGAIDAPNLKPIWSLAAPPNSVVPNVHGVSIVDQKVYATMVQGYGPSGLYHVRRIDGRTGAIDWSSIVFGTSHSGVSAPSVSSGRVFVHHFGNSGVSGHDEDDFPALVSFDPISGDQLSWTTHEGSWSSGSRPTIYENTILAAGGNCCGFDTYGPDGARQQHVDTPVDDFTPSVDENYIYGFNGSSGIVHVFDRNTFQPEFTIPFPNSYGAVSHQSVMIGDKGDIFLRNYVDHSARPNPVALVAIDVEQKTVRWTKRGDFYSIPAVANGMVAIADGNILRVFDQLTGNELWTWSSFELKRNVVLTRDYAFVNANYGVHAIDLTTGQSVWSVKNLQGDLAIDNGLLIVSNAEGVHAFSAVPEPTWLVSLLSPALAFTVCWRHSRT